MAVVAIMNSGKMKSMHLRQCLAFLEAKTSVQKILEGGTIELQME